MIPPAVWTCDYLDKYSGEKNLVSAEKAFMVPPEAFQAWASEFQRELERNWSISREGGIPISRAKQNDVRNIAEKS
jgi:hypothetical protein